MTDDSRSPGRPDGRPDKPAKPTQPDKPDLDGALRDLVAEDREALGEHPDPETLLDYHEAKLPEAEADRVQEHLARCPDCAQAVLDFAAFPRLEPPREEHRWTPADVERERRALERRLEAEARPTWQRHEVLLPLAAIFLVAALGLGLWAATLRERMAALSGPRGDVYVLGSLPPEGSGIRGGDPREIPPWAGRLHVYLPLAPAEPGEEQYSAHEVDVVRGGEAEEDASGPVVSGLPVERSPEGLFVLDLPRSLLPAGEYTFRLFGTGSEGREELARYPLAIGEGGG